MSPRRASDEEGDDNGGTVFLSSNASEAAGASLSFRAARSFADAAANLSGPTLSSQGTQKNDASIALAVEAVASRASARQEEVDSETK